MTDPINEAFAKTLTPQQVPAPRPRGDVLADALNLLKKAKAEIERLRLAVDGERRVKEAMIADNERLSQMYLDIRKDVLAVERMSDGRWDTIQMLRRKLLIAKGVGLGLLISTAGLGIAFLWALAQ